MLGEFARAEVHELLEEQVQQGREACEVTAIVGGARTTYYIRDVSSPSRSVGAMLRPGAAELLFGVPADELAGRHTRLRELWGPAAASTRSRLLEARDPEQRLNVLEGFLARRLPSVNGLHPAVMEALAGLHRQRNIEALVRESHYSHRHFNALFRHAVGVAPKAYARVLRFRNALRILALRGDASLAAIASQAGYSDQAHFTRAFVDMAGVTPSIYRSWSPAGSRHLALPARPP